MDALTVLIVMLILGSAGALAALVYLLLALARWIAVPRDLDRLADLQRQIDAIRPPPRLYADGESNEHFPRPSA